jgi:hypothetical protein
MKELDLNEKKRLMGRVAVQLWSIVGCTEEEFNEALVNRAQTAVHSLQELNEELNDDTIKIEIDAMLVEIDIELDNFHVLSMGELVEIKQFKQLHTDVEIVDKLIHNSLNE